MIIAIDTTSPTCNIWLIETENRTHDVWEAGRQLGDELLGHLRELLNEHNKSWKSISGIAVLRGPGSFTGLRIGLTVMNTIADTYSIPIIGEQGDDWLERALSRLISSENDELVMPLYGRDANITKPRK